MKHNRKCYLYFEWIQIRNSGQIENVLADRHSNSLGGLFVVVNI